MSLRLHIRQGTTPDTRLCDSCTFSVIMQGEGVGEKVYCKDLTWEGAHPISFKVVRCSNYNRKDAGPSLRAMEGMAMILTEQGPLKTVGFMSAREWRRRHKDDELIPDEATRRLT